MEKPLHPLIAHSTPDAAPKLARWLGANRINNVAAGRMLGVTGEAVRKWCLPFADRARQVPGTAHMERIAEWTGGEVLAADFYPPHLRRKADGGAEGEGAPA